MLTTVTTALAWTSVGWLSNAIYRQACIVIRTVRDSTLQPATVDYLSSEHDKHVTLRGNFPDPYGIYPENRFRTKQLSAGQKLEWIEVPPQKYPRPNALSADSGTHQPVPLNPVAPPDTY